MEDKEYKKNSTTFVSIIREGIGTKEEFGSN
jgi:hypothetical protein